MAFRVGQKVVCVNVTGHFGTWHPVGDLGALTLNAIYTVKSVGIYRECPTVWLEEIVREIRMVDFGEPGYSILRFRPLIEKSTDAGMAILREILDRETDKPPVKAQPRKSEVS